MKFISFGDLVEVTYDDESIELISKEKAAELGYSKQTVVCITYRQQTYTSTQFSKLTGINTCTILNYYHDGLHTGEEILERYNKNIQSKTKEILYENKLYNIRQFSYITKIPVTTINRYYHNGLVTGEEIIAAYKRCREHKLTIELTYKGKVYNSKQFSAITNMSDTFIRDCYKRGLRTGEEIIEAYAEYKSTVNNYSIMYKSIAYNSKQLSNILKIPAPTIRQYYNKGLRTGEEILSAYTANQKGHEKLVSYKNNIYNLSQINKLTGIPRHFISHSYSLGIRTGEEIIERYYKNKR